MKNRKLLFYFSGIILFIAGCAKDYRGGIAIDPAPPVEPPKPYTITEGFETGTKGEYKQGDVQLTTGTWNFNDALIGNLAADLKNGLKSVRLRTGDFTMKFDISGLQQISIKHGKYGNDANQTWQLLMSDDGGATYKQLGSDFNEMNTTLVTDSFKIVTTKKVRFQIKKIATAGATPRINIDDITFKGVGDAGIIVGGATDNSGADTTKTTSPPNPERGVTAGTDAQPLNGDNSNLLFGNPSGAQPAVVMTDNYLIDQSYYVESYSNNRGTPNWVSWHLDASNITNSAPRGDNFAGFIGLSTTFYHVESNAYQNSGFDRGHNCPSADRTSSASANSATFLMTNMIPQAPNNNEQTWANMENYLRAQVVEGNEVYIVMGNYGVGGMGNNGAANKINNDHVTVPSNVWKVAVIVPTGDNDLGRVSANTRVIAVNTPNINTTSTDWKNYRVTVRDIEKATGYNLFSNLPQSVQDAIEIKKDAL
ncbi:DNA/RNA non-specific endonuclease [Mucilaginibacter sp.]|uniref:DNA/RNA non-specific endonuclease n=1 Tax=Mucilaginibacter sp. TaxID=1882438 RepID=UPI0035BC4FF3